MVIWKYRMITEDNSQEIQIPGYKEALAAGLDSNNDLCVWCLVDPTAAYQNVRFYCVGTGWDLEAIKQPFTARHVGSVNQFGYLWHVFAEEVE